MTVIDVHTHLIPALPESTLQGTGLRLVDGVLSGADGVRVGPPSITRPEALVAWLRGAGIDAAAVSVPPPLHRQRLDAEAAAAWVRALNTELVAAVAPHPQLHALGYVPLEHPEVALAEARTLLAAGTLGLTGAAGGRSVALDDPRLAPLWALCADEDVSFLLHPAASPDQRLESHYLENLLGNPVETALSAGQLVLGGVLQEHPALRIALVHCGGVVPAVAGRWAQGVRTKRPGVLIDEAALQTGLRALWIDTLAHSPALLRLAADVVGADHVLLGSDWPFPMGSTDPRADALALGERAEAVGAAHAAVFLGSRWAARVGTSEGGMARGEAGGEPRRLHREGWTGSR